MSRSEGERQVTDRVVDFDKAKQKPTEVKKARRLKSMQQAFAAVSYTHLRAHETS